MASLIGFALFFLLCFLFVFFKSVPIGNVVIIDRNGHYKKTVKYGIYFFNPLTDKITTEISNRNCNKYYTNIFETSDTRFIKLSYAVSYHSENITRTLQSLEQSRRSIDDVINCSIYTVVLNNNYIDFSNEMLRIKEEIVKKAKFDANSLDFILDNLYISKANEELDPSIQKTKFEPHVSSNRGPIKYM